MLPWEAKARTLDAPVDDVLPILELLSHEADVSYATAGFNADDFYQDEWDEACRICNPSR
jgi:hypothetical protein